MDLSMEHVVCWRKYTKKGTLQVLKVGDAALGVAHPDLLQRVELGFPLGHRH